ncbi:DUF3828 domain-containing protein [Dyella caseinilytica]|uniref:DUF3828 domain-containing protein n=1 Tax=Dyella caseinilytica TaxID=1849581 RepID=A0ABX7GRY6_9GAMM|nr:DUF3828 domain-containing protein [Dyella caseinilytica]QRN53010.1 DUF3828 domain-containing protein [Dyella caseinilytica]GGA10754.1 hypothetical protein GCM10011408_35080 [Dyella caseinilytica]
MTKKLSLVVVSLLVFICTFVAQAASAQNESTPESDIRAFYSWYIQLESQLKYPLLDNNIYTYVEKRTVDALRNDYRRSKLPGNADYFTKVQDFDEKDWASNIAPHPAIMLKDVAVVPVTFGSSDKVSILVFLRKQGENWKIMKVEDTQDYF